MGNDNGRDQRSSSLDRIEAVYGPSGWNFARRSAWLKAVEDISPDAVERGSLDLVRQFEGRIPMPATLRAYASKHQKRSRAPLPAELPVDEAALIDAKMAKQIFANQADPLFSQDEMDEQIADIAERLEAGDERPVDMEQVAIDAPPLVAAAIRRARKRIMLEVSE